LKVLVAAGAGAGDDTQVVPSLVRTFPVVLGATKVGLAAPLPSKTLFKVRVERLVPPFETGTKLLYEVTLPTEVISPVLFALAVTVAALPVIDPEIGAVTVSPDNVPTLVREDETTVDFKVVPVKVLASAVTVIGALPSKLTPLIALGVARVLAVAALPPIFSAVAVPVKFVATPLDGVPSAGVTNVGDVSITNVEPVPVCDATDVALPTEVIGPVKFALTVAVPDVFPVPPFDIGYTGWT
jgi:hypothetical protein